MAVLGVLFGVLVIAACAVPPAAPTDRVPLRWSAVRDADVAEIVYGTDVENVADLYLPTKGRNRGVIIMVHGGAFVGGSRHDVIDTSGIVMAQTERGFSVLNMDYRLTSGEENVFPAAVDDVSAAVRWVREQGPELGVNPGTILVAGHSAGATIATLTALGWNSPQSGPLGTTERVDGYISFAGVMDFGPTATISAKYGSAWLGPNALKENIRRAASPVAHLDSADPPGFAVHGMSDNLVEPQQLDRMINAVPNSGSPATKLHYDRVTGGDVACRWHLPQCGTNSTQLNRWIDRVVAREL